MTSSDRRSAEHPGVAASSDSGVDSPARRTVVRAVAAPLALVGLVLVAYFAAPLDREFDGGTVVVLLVGLAGVGLLVAWQVRAIVNAPHPLVRGLAALALSLPLFLVLFAAVYVVLATTEPGSFSEPLSKVDAFYFVVTVFATVGFGDIAPVSGIARSLVTVQMIADLVLIGLALKSILAAVEHGRRRRAEERAAPGAVTRRG
jgi:voltage-gated potassium channel